MRRSLRARVSEYASPTAFGTCEAIVLVCGGTQSSREPQTLCRPCEIGSSRDAHKLSSVSNTGVASKRCRARATMKAPDR